MGYLVPDWQLVREFGSYLHNVQSPGTPGVCGICSSPTTDGFARCMSCQKLHNLVQAKGVVSYLADRVAFMTYAVVGGQAYSVHRGYKDKNLQWREQHWNAAVTWLVWFLQRHGPCVRSVAAGPAQQEWMWATVPSVRSGRTGEHPLHHIVGRIWGGSFPEAVLQLAPGLAGQPRDYDPNMFAAARLSAGTHVVLVDDSWTTGANAQSAASALKRAGASKVFVMVLGRLLNDSWLPTDQFIKAGGLRSPFDPNVCPWGNPPHGP